MIGYLIHLFKPWHGIRHFLHVARDEDSLLQELSVCPAFDSLEQWERSRIVRCFTTPADWDDWDKSSLAELCSECDHGRTAT
jgi:hypothetical protein